jgi:hypothetical protein
MTGAEKSVLISVLIVDIDTSSNMGYHQYSTKTEKEDK